MDTKEQSPEDAFLGVLADILRQSASPQAQETRDLILRRIALAGDVTPSRLPPPLNITELGGYLNLLESLGENQLRQRMLSATLGVALPETQAEIYVSGPVLFFAERPNDRPEGDQQAAMPLTFTMRSDFVKAIDALLAALHAVGCKLPILSRPRSLPPAGSKAPAGRDLLALVGRTLDLVPAAALMNPETDALVVGNLQGERKIQLAAQGIGPVADGSTPPDQAIWEVWAWDATQAEFIQATLTAALLPLEKSLNAAGWYNPGIQPPQTPAEQGGWNSWTNVTGLVAGKTRYGDELGLLYTQSEVVASAVREMVDWVWDGKNFVKN